MVDDHEARDFGPLLASLDLQCEFTRGRVQRNRQGMRGTRTFQENVEAFAGPGTLGA